MSIQINQVTKKYAEDIILENISLKINDHEHIGIIGENGCGKSTLLKIIAGLENVQQGEVILSKNTKIAYLNQTFESYEGSVEAFLLDSFQELNELQIRMHDYEQQIALCKDEQEMNQLLTQYGRVCERFECAGGYEVTAFLQQITSGLSISHLCDRAYNALSGGEKMRVHLAKLLLQKPNVLLLDEPTNHLDFKGIVWLENYLKSIDAIVIVVSHDRMFLNHTVSRLLEIECGEITNFIGNYDAYKAEKALLLEQLREDYDQQQKLILKLQNSIRRYRQWGNESDNEKFYKKAKQLERKLETLERLKFPKASQREMQIRLKECERSAKEVLTCTDLMKQFGEKVILNHAQFSLYWQDRIAIAGENGCGKSTFIKAIMQEEGLDGGEIKIGSRVKIGYLPQIIAYENDKMRLIDYFIKNASVSEENARRYLHQFGFSHVDMPKWLKHLSGGESVRLKLALILLEGVNFIIFDEPTNHLDYQSIEIIEELLTDFHGTLLIVSHDRMFIEKLCDKQITLKDGEFICE